MSSADGEEKDEMVWWLGCGSWDINCRLGWAKLFIVNC